MELPKVRRPIKANPVYTKDAVAGGTTKGHKLKDQRVTVCTDCRKGIFEGTERVWTNRGLVHKECNETATTA
jgi:hypothetical protein